MYQQMDVAGYVPVTIIKLYLQKQVGRADLAHKPPLSLALKALFCLLL